MLVEYVAYGRIHPYGKPEVIGRYKWKWLADMRAWLWTAGSLIAQSWVDAEEKVMN